MVATVMGSTVIQEGMVATPSQCPFPDRRGWQPMAAEKHEHFVKNPRQDDTG